MPRFDYTAAVEELQHFRLTSERQSERVAALGARLIRDKQISNLGDEETQNNPLVTVWPVYEQVTIAALDVGDLALADHCIDQLKTRFTEKSLRFRRLQGMRLEAEGKLGDAQAIYNSILQEDETNMLASKRQIALLIARKKEHEAIDALTKYLDTYYDDHEAWLELCDLYLMHHSYDQAAFCCEELLLLQPANHIFHLKYAELMYTMNNLPLALKQYCKVLELCTDHVRALYGLRLCASKLLDDKDVNHAADLHALATERLLKVNEKSKPEIRKVVQDYLANY
ncbi:ER membrane complex subunit 2 [Apophysomyces ossiformis]|uniref:ER membrane protein complex subunit 2 n=1 Tax=Apophysomyces ossiformis TaxID=679940 RepID=A0A8H7ESB4_9FUNG|nr:ER membrane complex subunit 2 [Apophysomyces ossiformis]